MELRQLRRDLPILEHPVEESFKANPAGFGEKLKLLQDSE